MSYRGRLNNRKPCYQLKSENTHSFAILVFGMFVLFLHKYTSTQVVAAPCTPAAPHHAASQPNHQTQNDVQQQQSLLSISIQTAAAVRRYLAVEFNRRCLGHEWLLACLRAWLCEHICLRGTDSGAGYQSSALSAPGVSLLPVCYYNRQQKQRLAC